MASDEESASSLAAGPSNRAPMLLPPTLDPFSLDLSLNDHSRQGWGDMLSSSRNSPPPRRMRLLTAFELNNGERIPEKEGLIFLDLLGKGSFSNVFTVNNFRDKRKSVIKVMDKNCVPFDRFRVMVKREREVLEKLGEYRLDHVPFFIQFLNAFQDSAFVYFELSFAENKDLYKYTKTYGLLDTECLRFYGGEILLALEHMHNLNILHRDLKPENIFLSKRMHILIGDFGCSRFENDVSSLENIHLPQKKSFVGTVYYIPPEVMDFQQYNRSCDLWAFAAILYELVVGFPPFSSRSKWFIQQKVRNIIYDFPHSFNPYLKHLISSILVFKPENRLGMRDQEYYTSIRGHPFFRGVDFGTLYKQTPPTVQLMEYFKDQAMVQKLSAIEDFTERYEIEPLVLQNDSFDEKELILHLKELTQLDIERRLIEQQLDFPCMHIICQKNLILMRANVVTRGFFNKAYLMVLTLGPHLYLLKKKSLALVEEIPWCNNISVKIKNSRSFKIITDTRTYKLKDLAHNAENWADAIEEVRKYYSRANQTQTDD